MSVPPALRTRSALACLILTLGAGMWRPAPADAQYVPRFDRRMAQHFGLENMWTTQVQARAYLGNFVGMAIHASSAKALSVFEVVDAASGELLHSFNDRQLDPFGEPLGVEKAHRKAAEWAAERKNAGQDARVKPVTVPDVILVSVSKTGLVQAIDAENGKTRWTRQVGDRRYPTTPAAISDQYVAVINGVRVYLMDRETGNPVWDRGVEGVPVARPALSNSRLFVISANGLMQILGLEDPRRPISRYKSHGRAIVSPIVTASSVVWPTDAGHFYVAPNSRAGVNYRIESAQSAVAPAAFLAPHYLYLAATDGDVYCLHEVTGSTLWRQPTGESVTRAPVAIGDSLYVATDSGNMYCYDAVTGVQRWWQSDLEQIIAMGASQRLYCVNRTGQMCIVDSKAGGIMAVLPTASYYDSNLVMNTITDRIYLTDQRGRIECLREAGTRWPTMLASFGEQQPPAGAAPAPAPADPADPGAAPPINPFAPPAAGGAPLANPFAAPPAGGAPPPNPFAPAPGGGAPPPNPFAPAPGGGAPPPNPFDAPAGGAAPPANPFAPAN